MKTVPRVARMLDAVGLLLFLGGGGVFAWAWVGFRRLRDYQPPPDAPAWSTVEIADGYSRIQTIGGAVMLTAIGVFLVAAWVARRPGPAVPEEA